MYQGMVVQPWKWRPSPAAPMSLPRGIGSSFAPVLPTCSWRGLSFRLPLYKPGPSSGGIMIGQQAPSEFGGATSPAAGALVNSISGSGAGKVSSTGSAESLGSSSTSIFCAISRSMLGCYSSRFSERYDLPGICWPFYRLQPWPSCILIGALRSHDCLS